MAHFRGTSHKLQLIFLPIQCIEGEKAKKNWENQYFQSELHMKAFFTEKSYKNIFMASFIVCSSLNTPNYVYCVKLREKKIDIFHIWPWSGDDIKGYVFICNFLVSFTLKFFKIFKRGLNLQFKFSSSFL